MHMKILNIRLFAIAGLLLVLSAFTLIKTGNIQGKVAPAESVAEVQVILGADTLRTLPVNGSFSFKNIKTGTYILRVKAKAPNQDVIVKDVAVIDSVTTDVGLINLMP
jgi:hypothetical protein